MAGSNVSGGDTRTPASLFGDDDDEVAGRRRPLFPSPRKAATIDILSASHQRRCYVGWFMCKVRRGAEGCGTVGLCRV